MSDGITTYRIPKGWEYGHHPNFKFSTHIINSHDSGQSITKSVTESSIRRTYTKWQGHYGDDMSLTLPRPGKEGSFEADVFLQNRDGTWTRTRRTIRGIMNEHGDILKLSEWGSDGHGHSLTSSLIDDILVRSEKYPKPFVRFAKKCLAYMKKIKL